MDNLLFIYINIAGLVVIVHEYIVNFLFIIYRFHPSVPKDKIGL